MASLTIRNFDEVLKRRLRVRAAEYDRTMQDEAREILRKALATPQESKDLVAAIKNLFADLGGVKLHLPPRDSIHEDPKFVFPEDRAE